MKTSDFNFHLPEELIAQHPLEKRDTSRLMVLDKATGEIEHKHFYDVLNYLNPGDTLVLNNTRVLPARLIGEKENTGGKIEFLLLKRIEGDNNMSFKEFDMNEIEENKKKYAKEVKERWGTSKAYEESEKKTSSYNKEKWGDINQETSEIFKGFAELRNSDPGSEEVQELVRRWQKYITDNFYTCTNEILSGLGLMYVEDERFKENLDKNGEGTAKLMAEAIKIYCSK